MIVINDSFYHDKPQYLACTPLFSVNRDYVISDTALKQSAT